VRPSIPHDSSGNDALGALPGGPFGVISADFNGDGISDLAMLTPGQEVIVLLGTADGLYRQSYRTGLDRDAQGLYAADLNGDGKLDLAVLHAGGRRVSRFHGKGDGRFLPTRGASSVRPSTWSLTPRELQVARLAAGGYTCTEIAAELGISRRTIEAHVKAIRSKLDLKHKRELVSLLKTPGG